MTPARSHIPKTLLGLLLAGAGLGAPPPSEGEVLPEWARLEFKATKLFVTARSALEIELEPGSAAEPQWAAIEPAPSVPEQVVRVRSTATFLGRTSTTDVWLDPRDLRAFQRHAVDSGNRNRHKIYRFGKRQILALRSEPETKEEAGLPEPQWTRRSEQRLELEGDQIVTDPVAVFYLLSRRPTTVQELHIVTSNSLGAVRIELAERGMIESAAEWMDTDSGPVATFPGARPGLRYTVTPTDVDSDFSLLGLEGAISVWIDEEYGVPLEVRGKISPVGSVRVRLERAVLRDSGSSARVEPARREI